MEKKPLTYFRAHPLQQEPNDKVLQRIRTNGIDCRVWEELKRGFYSGAVGYFAFNGDMDSSIAIRTALINRDSITLPSWCWGSGWFYPWTRIFRGSK